MTWCDMSHVSHSVDWIPQTHMTHVQHVGAAADDPSHRVECVRHSLCDLDSSDSWCDMV